MKIRKIDVQDIEGFKIGNADNIDKGTGCTVIICENGAVAGVDVRGGGPATRETDLLKSENTIQTIHAVVISGGSAFGLESGSGVMRELAERGIGFATSDAKIPIVCGASLYDLNLGSSSFFPDIDMGRAACRNAYEGKFENGNRGAGTGASVGKFKGIKRAMKTGLGTFACADEYVKVGAVTALNAMGDIYNGAGNIIAGFRTEDGASIHGTIKSLKSQVHNEIGIEDSFTGNPLYTTIDERNKNKSEIAEAIRSAFTKKQNVDSNSEKRRLKSGEAADSISENTSFDELTKFYTSDVMVAGQDHSLISDAGAAQDEVATELPFGDAVFTVSDILTNKSNTAPKVNEKPTLKKNPAPSKPDSMPETENASDDSDMGYDISFNTTISCLLTNAKMTKAQANKLASILHDAYARAIKPVHSTMDGDTIFVMTTNSQEVNFDAFAALATDVLQYAIIDAAMSAESAYGLPAACDIIK